MNSFSSKAVLTSGNRSYTYYRLPALAERGFNLARLPFSLKILLENQGKVFSREELLGKIWGHDVIVTERTVDVNITRLRTKLGQFGSSLKNKTGYGYFFEF